MRRLPAPLAELADRLRPPARFVLWGSGRASDIQIGSLEDRRHQRLLLSIAISTRGLRQFVESMRRIGISAAEAIRQTRESVELVERSSPKTLELLKLQARLAGDRGHLTRGTDLEKVGRLVNGGNVAGLAAASGVVPGLDAALKRLADHQLRERVEEIRKGVERALPPVGLADVLKEDRNA